jgi:hypothetical protein
MIPIHLELEAIRLCEERADLRERERLAYDRDESRAKRTRYTQRINDINARMVAIKEEIKTA